MTDTVLTRVAALKTLPIPKLKQQWRDLFESEPPPYNRRFLEHRLAYRIQELAYGGLKPETVKRLAALAPQLTLVLGAHNVPVAKPGVLPELVDAIESVRGEKVEAVSVAGGKATYKVGEITFLLRAVSNR